MNVWTEVHSNATGNEIPTPSNTRHDWLSLRRLGGQLAGRLDPEPALLSGDGGACSTLRTATELSPYNITGWAVRSNPPPIDFIHSLVSLLTHSARNLR